MSKRSTLPIDKHVGARVKMRRHMMKISQQALGDKLGVSFQQVQKYEQGKTRIGSSRLQVIANVLNVPISFFFEDAPMLVPKPQDGARATALQSVDIISDFLATTDGLKLCAAFVRISRSGMRRGIVQLVERIAENEGSEKIIYPRSARRH